MKRKFAVNRHVSKGDECGGEGETGADVMLVRKAVYWLRILRQCRLSRNLSGRVCIGQLLGFFWLRGCVMVLDRRGFDTRVQRRYVRFASSF
jgi:hypothetical protein